MAGVLVYRAPKCSAVQPSSSAALGSDPAALVAAGSDPNAADDDGWTALHFGARYTKTPAIIAALVEAGARLDAVTNDSRMPIHVAAGLNSSAEVVAALVAAGSDPNAADDDGWTALHFGARYTKTPAIIAALVEAGARLDAVTNDSRMPIHVAAGLNSSAEVVAALVAAGSDPNAVGGGGWRPLHYAAAREDDSSAVIGALVAAGVDPNAADDEGWTALHVAAQFTKTPAIIAALVEAGAHLDAVTNKGGMPIHVAAGLNSSAEVVAALVAAGSDPNAAGANGWTPLHYAADREEASPAVVAALVAAGSDPDARDTEGGTALHYAAALGDSPEVLTALVGAGADPNAADENGWTPLHYATKHNSAAIVRTLIDLGADSGRRNSYGWAALTTATMFSETPMVAGEILRLHLPEGSLSEDGQWQRKGLHNATCWFEHDRAWPAKKCYYFVVNENPDDGSSPLIAFPVVRFRPGSTEPQGNPVLHLGGGGPGSAMDFETDPFYIWSEYKTLVSGSGRDLYVIDPRGVGMSYPRLHCLNALDPVREALSKPLNASEDGMVWNEAYVACKARLDSDGRNLSHYNSAAVAMDVEELKRALEVKQWVLWGNSYGARYALTIARDFPGSVEAMVLNSAAFPGLPYTETWAGDTERGIERALSWCGRNGVCDPKSLRDRFWGLVRSLDENPLTFTDLAVLSTFSVERMELTGSRLFGVVFSALYDDTFVEEFPFLVQQLENGRTSLLEKALSFWLGYLLDETSSDPVMNSHYCAEEQPYVDYEKAARDAKRANSHIQRLVTTGFELEKELCRIWDVEPAGPIESEPVRTSIPTLFLQGALDPATPIDHLDSQLENFADHEVMVFEDSSHWGSVYGRCAMEAAGHFIQHKSIEESHRKCLVP